MTFCPHCEVLLPGRTYRYHRQAYYDSVNKRWEKDASLLDSSSGDEVEIGSVAGVDANDDIIDGNGSVDNKESGGEGNETWENMYNEVWDDGHTDDVDRDFIENIQNPPFVSDQSDGNDSEITMQKSIIRSIAIVLVFFWTNFNISDRAMEFLLQFLSRILYVFSLTHHWMANLFHLFPGSVYLLRKEMNLLNDSFVKYVVCPKCDSLYSFEDCFHNVGSRNVSNTCGFIKFPNHRQRWRRTKCGAHLLKEVTLSDGKKRLYPHKVYCYNKVINSLKDLVKRANFVERCELWRTRGDIRTIHQLMCDVFEGRVWRDFQVVNGQPFLSERRNYALMLNVDWMQPFKRTQYSVGVLYMVLMNLPRHERFKRENVILVGIIPGPKEPSGNINSYLSPLVDELETLWNDGVLIKHPGALFPQRFRAALLCVACDVPAGRKTCGFLSHNSRKGCHRCTKQFVIGGVGEPSDYSGFDDCDLRTNAAHRAQVEQVCQQTTQEERTNLESEYGVRYSELLRLPYFDCVRFTIIDPMHNLFLGTAKRIIELWLDNGLLNSNNLKHVQEMVDKCESPSDLGRLPRKIEKSFGGFTAEQWKTWVLVFSLFSLFGQLQMEHYLCWVSFVEACAILCRPLIKINDVEKAHSALLKFCREFERLYKPGNVTPNMHLHTHLAECTLDYGPVYSFWLFSFERYNGVLGEFQTNNKSVEIQMMRKFLRDQCVYALAIPADYRNHFQELLDNFQTASVASSLTTHELLTTLSLGEGFVNPSDHLWYSLESYQFGTHHVPSHLDDDDVEVLANTYKTFFPTFTVDDVPRLFDKYESIQLAGVKYGSGMSRLNRSSYVLARWAGRFNGEIDITGSDLRPAFVKYFVRQIISFDGSSYSFCFARVVWFQAHPSRYLLGQSTVSPQLWCRNSFEPFGPSSFLPVQRITDKFVAGYGEVNRETVMYVLPLRAISRV